MLQALESGEPRAVLEHLLAAQRVMRAGSYWRSAICRLVPPPRRWRP